MPCATASKSRCTAPPSTTRPSSRRGGGSTGLLWKKAVDEGRTIVWVDQVGLYLLPLVVRTWAPCGQTPLLQVPLTRDHLSAISGITPDGRLFMQTGGVRLPLARCRALQAPP